MTANPIAAILAAEADARAAHDAGECGAGPWSCSHCESEATS